MSKNKNMDKASERKRMMKKLIALLFLPLFLACQKEMAPEDDMVTVSFLPQIESGNILTRSQFSDEVLDNLEYLMPSHVKLTGGGREYTVKSLESVSVQKGEYVIECSSTQSTCYPYSSLEVPVTATISKITIDDNKEYTIPVHPYAFIVACKSYITSFNWYYYWGDNYDITSNHVESINTENYRYYIIVPRYSQYNNIVIKLGETDNTEPKKVEIMTDHTKASEIIGKYFIIEPDSKDLRVFNFWNEVNWVSGYNEN